jgi:hypothetical protein
MGTGSFPGAESDRGVTLAPHTLLVPRSKKHSRAIPLLSLRAFVACTNQKPNIHPKIDGVPSLYTPQLQFLSTPEAQICVPAFQGASFFPLNTVLFKIATLAIVLAVVERMMTVYVSYKNKSPVFVPVVVRK